MSAPIVGPVLYVETGLYELFLADPNIHAIVGNRVYPLELPDEAPMPALTFQVVGGSSAPTFETRGLQRTRLQITAHAAGGRYPDAMRLRYAVQKVLEGFSGLLPGGFRLQNADFLQPIDTVGEQARQVQLSSEFYLYYTLR